MNLKRINIFIKNFALFSMLLTTALLFGLKYMSYSSTLESWDDAENEKRAQLSKINSNISKTKNNIKKLEDEKKRLLAEGIDVKQKKADTNAILNEMHSNDLSLRLSSMDYHKNFNNLLRVKLTVLKNNNKAKNLSNLFEAKRILSLNSVRVALGVYGDYDFKGNDIYYFSYAKK